MKRCYLLVIFLSPALAVADVTGTYVCSQSITTVVKANGRSRSVKTVATTTLRVNEDGTAVANNPAVPFPFNQAWSIAGKRFALTPIQDDVVRTANYSCLQTGVACTFIGDTYSSSLVTNRTYTQISGTTRLSLSMLMNGQIVTSTGTSKVRCNK